MGNRVIPIRNQLCINNSNQVACIGRFYGRLDTFGTTSPAALAPNIDTLPNRAWGHLGIGASVVLIAPSGLRTKYAARLEFEAPNNIAESKGLVLGLNKAKPLGARTLLAKIDTQVIAGQVEKEYMAQEPELAKYLAVVRALERRF